MISPLNHLQPLNGNRFRNSVTLKLEIKRNEIITDMIDAYVVASDWSWTYIKTHEKVLGLTFINGK